MSRRESNETTKAVLPILGVDIGGTKISVAVGSAAGEILASERFPSEVDKGPDYAMDRIALAVARLTRNMTIHDTVGVSAPGPLSSRDGIFLNPPNMPGWFEFPVKAALEKRLGLKVRLMNDANAAAAAEWFFGAGRGMETIVFLTMSTGMGAGLIIGGRLHEGLDDMAGEIGHIRVASDGPVGFGRRGSIEGFCSGPGLAQLAVMKLIQARHAGISSLLLNLGKDFRLVDAKDVGDAADKGDRVAREVFAECGRKLGEFCAMITDVLNPEAIILGTIGRIHEDLIIPPARAELDRLAHPRAAARVKILPAALGERTGDLAAICAAVA